MRSLIPVRSRLRHSLSLLLLAMLSAKAQDADEFFHGGAQHFLTNNIPGALEVVTNGLQRFPADEKLKKLYELLNQQQQQQQQNQDQKQQEQQDEKNQNQDQSKPDDKKDQSAKNEPQKSDSDQKPKESPTKQEQQKGDSQQSQAKEKPGDEKGEPAPTAAHQMTPQEAKQLLDAQKDDEQVLLFKPEGQPNNRQKQLKDW